MLFRQHLIQIPKNPTTGVDGDRDEIQKEINQLLAEIDRISTDTEFNTMTLLNGDFESTELKFQVGANESQVVALTIGHMNSESLGLKNSSDTTKTINLTSQASAAAAITTIDAAIRKVSSERSKLGAMQNRLEHTINNLNTTSENLTASESRIRDVDMAKEMMEFTKNSILQQAATAMLAQANQQPQGVLQLLQ